MDDGKLLGDIQTVRVGTRKRGPAVQAEHEGAQGGHRLDGAIDLLAYQIQSCGLAVLLE